MPTRLSPDPGNAPKSPRKRPAQARAIATVEAIVEAAARILEVDGFERYSTNAIAERAGVSIGSLYQYFPGKDAITRALIARETQALIDAVAAVPESIDWRETISALIRAAIDHQFQRPRLARLIDIEEQRLGGPASDVDTGAALADLLRPAILRSGLAAANNADEVIEDLLVIARALTDAAGERPDTSREALERRIHRAIFGYLGFGDARSGVQA